MKYFFIFNPVAGLSDPRGLFEDKLREVCERKGLDYEFLVTEGEGHATELAATAAAQATEEQPVRIFSVGGDGTLCETANGLMNKPYCELGCVPCGSGNDYSRIFGDKKEFLDFENYLTAPSISVDGIKADHLNALNICSLGLDAMICDMANRIKSADKRLSSSKAYDKAVKKCITGRLYNNLRVTIDDSEVFEGNYIFSLAASGQYYGGGYRGAPMAMPSDGMLDFVLMKTVSHLRAIALIGPYKKGTYYKKRSFKKLVIHRRGRKMSIEAKNPAIVNVDGECITIDKITFEIMPAALRFIVPPTFKSVAAVE